jgi:hypothetical protein
VLAATACEARKLPCWPWPEALGARPEAMSRFGGCKGKLGGGGRPLKAPNDGKFGTIFGGAWNGTLAEGCWPVPVTGGTGVPCLETW